MTDFNHFEIVATIAATMMVEQTLRLVELMEAVGPNPPTPAGQAVALKQIAEVRRRVLDGKARPALTRFLNPQERLARFQNETIRHDQVSQAPDLAAIARIYEQGTKLAEQQAK